MATIQDISTYLQQGTRNKIVFCKDDIEGIKFINVGIELASLLNNQPEEISGIETIYRQVLNQSQQDKDIGIYLAIENIGILFEPELKIDIRSILSNFSKNQILIVKTEALIDNDNLYFQNINDNVYVSLQDLSFKQI